MTLLLMSDLDGPPPEAATPDEPVPVTSAPPIAPAPAGRLRRCPECPTAFRPLHPTQLFCCPAHRKAFHNRQTARGSALVPMVMAARQTRDGSRGDKVTGKRAALNMRTLIQGWKDEDEKAGRMPMVEYARLRFKHVDLI